MNNLPYSITHLTLNNNFHGLIKNLSNSIMELMHKYNTHSKKKYQINIIEEIDNFSDLTFDYNFNQQINNLPNSITHLTLNF
jgi:hypothetical protein